MNYIVSVYSGNEKYAFSDPDRCENSIGSASECKDTKFLKKA